LTPRHLFSLNRRRGAENSSTPTMCLFSSARGGVPQTVG
jgi:hypothetical protein